MSLEDRLYPLLRLYEAAPAPLRSLAGHAYRALPLSWRNGAHFAGFQRLARESQEWTLDDARRYQVMAVRESLMAAARTPYYQRHFADAGVDPSDFSSLEQLSAYPTLTKQDLIAHREAMTNPAIPPADRLYLTTGGSSGVPVGFYLQRGVSRPKEQAFLEAQWARRGYRPGDRVAVIRGGVTSGKANGRIARFEAARNWLILSSYHLTPERLPEYLSALRAFQPQHLHAYPSAALMLARMLEQTGKAPQLRLTSILCGSEKLTPEQQAYLGNFFRAPVFHWYGHSERVVLAGQGPRSNHMYFWPSYGHVEFGPPEEDGRREIIGTSFHNHAMPLIRYRTGDYARLAASPAGEFGGMTEIESIEGREHEFLVSGQGRRISLTAINMHDRIFDGLLAVQFYQEEQGLVECRLQPGPEWHASRQDTIRRGLSEKLGDDFEFRLRVIREIEKTPAGKQRWLVTHLQATA
jgi:phenylacetate-CoA ligase